MRFLADENCDFAVVRALRSAGHDVLAVSDFGGKLAGAFVVLRPGSVRISSVVENAHD